MSGGAVVGLIAVAAFAVIVAAAFFWFMPREENPGPLDTLWGFGLRGTPEMDVARDLRRARDEAEREQAEREEPLPDRYRDDEGPSPGTR